MSATLPLAPGTVTATNGSATIAGVGTAFTNYRRGYSVLLPSGATVVLASDPTSDTAATITQAFGGTTEAGVAYTVLPLADGAQIAHEQRLLNEMLRATDVLGVSAAWLFSAVITAADPGNGYVRFNHATPASVTAIYIDDLDSRSVSLGAYLDTLANGQLLLRSSTRPNKFAIYAISAVVNSTGYRTLTVSWVAGAPDFQTDEPLVVVGVLAGATGPAGVPVGHRLTFSTTITDADPGAGAFRADNATFGSITKLWIDAADADAVDISTWLQTFDDNVNANARGYLTLKGATDTSVAMEFAVTGVVVDKTGYFEIPVSPISGAIPADATVTVASFAASGADGAAGSNGIDGTSILSRVRFVATANVDLATGLAAGQAIDGGTLATNDLVLLMGQTAAAQNGVYPSPAAGAASRLTAFNTYDSMPSCYFSVMEGTTNADTLWRCTSDKGGTIDVTALAFDEFSGGGGYASATSAKSANYTLTASDNGGVIPVDATAAARTITLLAAATAGDGYTCVVKKDDSSANTVTISGGTINGSATFVLRLEGQSVALICDGTEWHILSEGAIFEKGSNADGKYIRYANGHQVCTKQLTGQGPVNISDGGGDYVSAEISLGNWAKAFSATPVRSVDTFNATGYGSSSISVAATSSTSAGTVQLRRSTTSAQTDYGVDVIAVGDWY